MMAFQGNASLTNTGTARYATRKCLDSSMLDYSERMRMINTSRAGVGEDLKVGKRESGAWAGPSRLTGALTGDRRANQRDAALSPLGLLNDKNLVNTNGKQQHKEMSNKPSRRQRPLSFDDRELQHNINAVNTIKSRRRPSSLDDKELQRNKEINMQYRLKKNQGDAFTKSPQPIVIPTSGTRGETSPSNSQTGGEVRVSFLNASDLYELVNISRRSKQEAKENSKDIRGTDHLPPLRNASVPAPRNSFPTGKRVKNINITINTDLIVRKGQVSTASPDNKTHNHANSSSKSSEKDETDPLDALLQMVLSDYSGQDALKTRPKRAKRMALNKPKLVDIPEDLDAAQNGIKGTKPRYQLPPPSVTSLQAIRELRDTGGRGNDRKDTRTEGLANTSKNDSLESEVALKRSRFPDPGSGNASPTLSSPHIVQRKSKNANVNARSFESPVDLDSLLAASIYPPMPSSWDEPRAEPRQPRRQSVLLDKNGHKDRAHRKMKKIIFLRDRPAQHYRRDPL